MTDIRAHDLDDDDRLPWLEAVDEEEYREGPGAGKLIAYVILGLVAIGLVVGGVFWLRDSRTSAGVASGEPELIAAPPGDYKIKPADPGGMEVEGKADTALAASEGADPRGALDTSRPPEAPVAALPKQAPAAPAVEPDPAPARTDVAEATTANGGATIQLGAFDSEADANGAWKALSGRFAYLAPLSHGVVRAEVNGRTYYRLRASGAGARDVCRRLEIAGESCIAVR